MIGLRDFWDLLSAWLALAPDPELSAVESLGDENGDAVITYAAVADRRHQFTGIVFSTQSADLTPLSAPIPLIVEQDTGSGYAEVWRAYITQLGTGFLPCPATYAAGAAVRVTLNLPATGVGGTLFVTGKKTIR